MCKNLLWLIVLMVLLGCLSASPASHIWSRSLAGFSKAGVVDPPQIDNTNFGQEKDSHFLSDRRINHPLQQNNVDARPLAQDSQTQMIYLPFVSKEGTQTSQGEEWETAPNRYDTSLPQQLAANDQAVTLDRGLPEWQSSRLPPRQEEVLIAYDTRTGEAREVRLTPATKKSHANRLGSDSPLQAESTVETTINSAASFIPNTPAILGNFVRVSNNPGDFPWSAIVKLTVTFNNSAYHCNGALVDPQFVITSGDCIYDHDLGGWATSVVAYPTYSNGPSAVGAATDATLYSVKSWTQDRDLRRNWGLIKLDRPIGRLTGWLGFGYNTTDSYYDRSINNPAYIDQDYLYNRSGRFDTIEIDAFIHNGADIANNSGSVAFLQTDNGTRSVHGVTAFTRNSGAQTGFARMVQSVFDIFVGNIDDNTPSQPDLIPLQVTAPSTVNAGQQLGAMSYRVHNYSSVTYNGTITIKTYLSTNDTISSSDQLLSTTTVQPTSGIAPKGSILVTVTSPPQIPIHTAGGVYWIGIIIANTDANVGNNAASGWDAARVTVTAAQPQVRVSPNRLDFTATTGGSIASKRIFIDTSGFGSFNWSATANQPWIVLQPIASVSGTSLDVSINTTALPANQLTHNGEITINAPGTVEGFVKVPVALFLTQTCYQLTLTHTGAGSDPVAAFNRSTGCNEGYYDAGEVITLTATPADGWQVAGWRGTVNDASDAVVNTVMMPAAAHNASVVYQLQPRLQVSPTQLDFTADVGGSAPSSQSIMIDNNGTSSFVWSATTAENWIVLNPLTGPDGVSLTVNIDLAVLPTNQLTHNGEITINAPATVEGSAKIQVSLTLTPTETCYSLTLTHTGNGADPVATPQQSANCEATHYHAGEIIQFTAAPENGWQVSSWSGTRNDTSTTTTNDVKMPTANHAVNVDYREIPVEGPGDTYETDNRCTQHTPIATDGSEVQKRTFHTTADVDWVQFNAKAGITYRIEVQVPASSSADVNLELYTQCEGTLVDNWSESFSPNVRLDFKAKASGPIYLRMANQDATVAGNEVQYELSVRATTEETTNRALIIVAGRLRGNDRLQSNIHNVTNAVYKLFQRNGYNDDNIHYLATDSTLAGYDAAATTQSLRNAITDWAKQQIGADGVLTLYMIDHGSPGIFYLDELSGQRVTPNDLNEWLATLEEAVPTIKINVIIEACQSGSFLGTPKGISKTGRIIITSTTAENDAKASKEGAYFSDHLLTWLHQGYNLSVAFEEARIVAKSVFSLQEPQIDSNGNGIPNEFSDGALAAKRSFAYANTLSSDDWPPHIFSVIAPSAITDFSGRIETDIRDNLKVRQVLAVVYPPGYTPPATGQVLQGEDLPTFLLSPTGESNHYAGVITGLTKAGSYRVIIHAEDNQGLQARPKEIVIEIRTTSSLQLFLPLVTR